MSSSAKCQNCRKKPRKGMDPHNWAVTHAKESGHVTVFDEAVSNNVTLRTNIGISEKECVTQQIARILQRQGVWDPNKYEVYPPMEV